MDSIKKCCIVFFLTAKALAASAAVLVETREGAPDSKVIFSAVSQTQSDKDSYSWGRATQPPLRFGQSFVLSADATMEALTLKTVTLTATNASFVLNIYKVNALTDSPTTGGAPIYTGSGLLPSAQGPKPGYMTFTLDAPVALSQGVFYVFTLSYAGTGSGGLGLYRGTADAETADTSRFWSSSDGGASYAGTSKIAYLYIQGTTVVPEPSTAMLLLPGSWPE